MGRHPGCLNGRMAHSPATTIQGTETRARVHQARRTAGLRRAVFIDKDGTLVDDVPYNVDPARLSFKPGAFQALALLAAAGFALVVVSNQSGLATGRFTAEQFDRLRNALCRALWLHGVVLDGFMVCPHAPGADGTPACPCRKPAPGLFVEAARRLHLDLAASWMVGDILDDVEAGHRAGCRSLLFDSGGETLWRSGPGREPDARATTWRDVVRIILAAPQHPADARPG
jgi:D-glycero-D-manno-heptose 1,7-bisphosphate phosphatase